MPNEPPQAAPRTPWPQRPEIGYRANGALIGHGEPIVRPADYGEPLEAASHDPVS